MVISVNCYLVAAPHRARSVSEMETSETSPDICALPAQLGIKLESKKGNGGNDGYRDHMGDVLRGSACMLALVRALAMRLPVRFSHGWGFCPHLSRRGTSAQGTRIAK
jgi:hypothetical protein